MRTAIAIAAFAAGAIAVPHKRDIFTDWDIVYVTDVVTVTYGAEPTTTSAHHHGHHHTTWAPAPEPTTTSTYEAPISTYVPPPPPAWTPTPEPEPEPTTQQYTPQPAPVQKGPSDTDSGPVSAYSDIVIKHHNFHRKNHSCEDVTWSDSLYQSAKTIAASCVYAHNTDVDGGGYGQNIAAGVEPANISAIITDLFYNGEMSYFADQYGKDQPDMGQFELFGHFSQIVWKSTTEVACATQYCPGGLGNVGGGVSPYFTVCNYKSAGNFANEWASNVLPPLGHATVQWNTGISL